MNIGILIGRIGGMDGVALESEKWMTVLKDMGHQVFVLSGQFEDRSMDPDTETLVPEMSFFSPESFWSQKKAFFYPETDPAELEEHLGHYSELIYDKILDWIRLRKIDLLISENASALPSHLEMGMAIHKAVLHTGLPTISHDHEFSWDRGDRYRSPHPEINAIVESVFPLRAPNSVHAVINSHSAHMLQDRYGRDSLNIPNVMNFDLPYGVVTEHSQKLVSELGFRNDDLLLLQPTRIVRRKGIETAIELLHRLDNPRVKLLLTGSYTDDAGSAYFNELMTRIQELGLLNRVRFAKEKFQREEAPDQGMLRFSISNAYAASAAVCYFSHYEGFGNVIVESVLARRPLFVNNYEPVFMPDIGSKGFQTIMIEKGQLRDEDVAAMARVLYEPDHARAMCEHNFELGKQHFSFHTLRTGLEELISRAIKAAGGKEQ